MRPSGRRNKTSEQFSVWTACVCVKGRPSEGVETATRELPSQHFVRDLPENQAILPRRQRPVVAIDSHDP
jgi:hypothetical protein